MDEEQDIENEITGTEGLPIVGPSGAKYTVLNEEEVNYYEDIMNRYLEHNAFSNMSDLQELDRIIIMELIYWRWSNWLLSEQDYWDTPIDVDEINRRCKILSGEIRLVKKNLGIDKSSRDKDTGSTMAEKWENLGRRAKEFVYHREEQFSKGMILINELIALVTLNGQTDKIEQKELHCTDQDVLNWMRTVMIPEYEAIDYNFRHNQQRFWVRDL